MPPMCGGCALSMLLLLLLFASSCTCTATALSPVQGPFGSPSELGEYMISAFAKEEEDRSQLVRNKYNYAIEKLGADDMRDIKQLTNLSFRLSSTPFVTTAGFRDLCFPNVLDNIWPDDLCALPPDPVAFFSSVADGACIFMTSRCYFTIMKLDLLQYVPQRFSLIAHFNDIATPDMDVKKKGVYGTTKTSSTLQKLHEAGRLLSFHGMNLHYSQWHRPGVQRPSWLHCIPIGMSSRFYQRRHALSVFVDAIKRNVAQRSREFWRDSGRPLLLVPVVPKAYAPDRVKALQELWVNTVRKKNLRMTEQTYDKPVDFYNAVAKHRFTLCPWGNGLDTHRLYEVLALGGIPVVKVSSINSCLDNTDNDINVTSVNPRDGTSRIDLVQRGQVPFVLVKSWSEVTTAMLEEHWLAVVGSRRKRGQQGTEEEKTWDYSRVTMQHWRERILGLDSVGANITNLEKIVGL